MNPADVEYPDGDEGEVFDLVVRKAPISFDGLMDQIATFSADEVYEHLETLRDAGYVDRREGDLGKDGTTRDLWYVDQSSANEDGDGR